jgi:hypothetical protein
MDAVDLLLDNAPHWPTAGEPGAFFEKKQYEPHPLPAFETTRDTPPAPIFDEDKSYVSCYWKAR